MAHQIGAVWAPRRRLEAAWTTKRPWTGPAERTGQQIGGKFGRSGQSRCQSVRSVLETSHKSSKAGAESQSN